jgi:hypothetical protein
MHHLHDSQETLRTRLKRAFQLLTAKEIYIKTNDARNMESATPDAQQDIIAFLLTSP